MVSAHARYYIFPDASTWSMCAINMLQTTEMTKEATPGPPTQRQRQGQDFALWAAPGLSLLAPSTAQVIVSPSMGAIQATHRHMWGMLQEIYNNLWQQGSSLTDKMCMGKIQKSILHVQRSTFLLAFESGYFNLPAWYGHHLRDIMCLYDLPGSQFDLPGSRKFKSPHGGEFCRCSVLPSWERTYPLPFGTFESMIFLFPRWDMLVSWRVINCIVISSRP